MKTPTTRIVLLTAIAGIAASTALAQNAAPAAKPAAASAAAEPTQDTSEGALKLFIAHIKKGEFTKVAELCDPGSESFNDFTEMAKQLDPATANPKIPAEQLQIIRDFFTKPWQDVEHALIAEQGPRAQYSIKFFGIDPKTQKRTETGAQTIDLNQFEGKWRIIATPQLLRPGQSPTAPAPTAAPAPADATKPADGAAPAPAKP
jgi:hypothetical protein